MPTQVSQNEVGGKEEKKSNVYTLWKDQNSSMWSNHSGNSVDIAEKEGEKNGEGEEGESQD